MNISATGIWDLVGESGSATLIAAISSAAQNATVSLYGKAAWGQEGATTIAIQAGAGITVQAGATIQIFF